MVAKTTGDKTQAVVGAGPDYRLSAGKAASNYAEDEPRPAASCPGARAEKCRL